MPLSISNRAHISQQELDALTRWNQASEIVVINQAAEGGPKIETLSKDDLNCWQFFLRFFNMGKLAKLKIDLLGVTEHLNQYDWSVGARPDSEYHPAYAKVCMLANKVLNSEWDETLLNNVCVQQVNKTIEFSQFRGMKLLNKHDMGQTFKWNPSMQVKHVDAFLRKQFERAIIRIEDDNNHPLSLNTNLSQRELMNAKIFIDQRLLFV